MWLTSEGTDSSECLSVPHDQARPRAGVACAPACVHVLLPADACVRAYILRCHSYLHAHTRRKNTNTNANTRVHTQTHKCLPARAGDEGFALNLEKAKLENAHAHSMLVSFAMHIGLFCYVNSRMLTLTNSLSLLRLSSSTHVED